jgi:hypothetical protein
MTIKSTNPAANTALDIGEIIDAGSARREAEREAARPRFADAERYAAAVDEAAALVARTLAATSVAPSTDVIFVAAGFTPNTETRMAALTAGRRIYANRAEVLRLEHAAGVTRAEARVHSAVNVARFELDRVVRDPKCGLDAIFTAVIALRRATELVHGVEAVTVDAAVELAVQYRSGLS